MVQRVGEKLRQISSLTLSTDGRAIDPPELVTAEPQPCQSHNCVSVDDAHGIAIDDYHVVAQAAAGMTRATAGMAEGSMLLRSSPAVVWPNTSTG